MAPAWDKVEDLWPASVLGDGWYGMPRLVKRLLAVLDVPYRAREVLEALIGRRWKRGDLMYADKRVEFETGLAPSEIEEELATLVDLKLIQPVPTEEGTAYGLEPLVERVEEALADGRIAPYPKRPRRKSRALKEGTAAAQGGKTRDSAGGNSGARDSGTRDSGGDKHLSPYPENPRSTPGRLRAHAREDIQDTIGRIRPRGAPRDRCDAESERRTPEPPPWYGR